MARYTGPVCRLCRRERTKLFLKGPKCMSAKCPITQGRVPPGQHGRDRQRQPSEYAIQLREKQRARRTYGVMGKQFQRFYRDAARRSGITGENLLALLELRLDNVVFRALWGSSRAQARQLVRHGHVLVDGQRVDIPSYRLRPGQVVTLNPKARDLDIIAFNREHLTREVPAWLEVTDGGSGVRVLSVPLRDQIDTEVREQLIVELFSK
ncbi:ribosomal protein S4 [Acidimicrobium ferrooxidans DSM 10331]|uniref:Small ribosomal subunit protein uS4 n=1 Tax=Acidimicrobium ferrooxidans (strain DSM 10331 / JCM 15462 / NBRC 103882 / ICP) TaxID=525909 RepID=C7M2Z9_ACIFD|nr:30S ribosomal protein S4 [Acidimicrobium ferrooxidans]ACU53393.1 ribosomal protein S4 [Acidimicrobium ferrooxidans DSM 10331]